MERPDTATHEANPPNGAYFLSALLILAFVHIITPDLCAESLPLDSLRLPRGFEISVYAEQLPDARSLALGTKGTLFVGTRRTGVVYAVRDNDGDHRADQVITIAGNLNWPNGVAFRNGSLYVAEINRIIRYDDIEERLNSPPKPVIVNDSFPSDRAHGWKFIRFGPDGKLYVPVGAPCNVCREKNPVYASITRMNADGTGLEIFAHGVRNSVGFDWHPETKELWFTDNGRDWMGDDVPPDELNRAPKKGLHFGFPFCHGGVPDPVFGEGRSCKEFAPHALSMAAHVAALGMRFYRGKMFPPEYRNRIFIAQHGSWNRSTPIGYRLIAVTLKKNRVDKSEIFADGWLQGDVAWGRPVDVLVMPDGALLVSDDRAGAVYRISYSRVE